MYLQWDNKFSLGVKEIDDRHQELLARINALRKALMEGENGIETDRIIDFLEDYAVTHFDEEERIMQLFRYPFYQDHKQAHLAFIKEVAELKHRMRAPEARERFMPYLAVELERRMSDWFLYHIGNRDRKLADFLAGRL